MVLRRTPLAGGSFADRHWSRSLGTFDGQSAPKRIRAYSSVLVLAGWALVVRFPWLLYDRNQIRAVCACESATYCRRNFACRSACERTHACGAASAHIGHHTDRRFSMVHNNVATSTPRRTLCGLIGMFFFCLVGCPKDRAIMDDNGLYCSTICFVELRRLRPRLCRVN